MFPNLHLTLYMYVHYDYAIECKTQLIIFNLIKYFSGPYRAPNIFLKQAM